MVGINVLAEKKIPQNDESVVSNNEGRENSHISTKFSISETIGYVFYISYRSTSNSSSVWL